MKVVHYELAKMLVELPIIKKTFLSKPIFHKTLSTCKIRIIDSYLSTISDIIIMAANSMTDIEINPSIENIRKNFKNLIEFFQLTFAHYEKDNTRVSPIYYLFHKFRERFEVEMFQKVQNQLEDQFIRGNLESTLSVIYKRFILNWYTFAELSVLFLSGLHLDCKKFRKEVYATETFRIYDPKIVENRSHGSCDLQDYIGDHGETVYVFMVDEFRFIEYINSMMGALIQTHTNVGGIDIIVDYKLHKPFTYIKEHYEVYEAAKQIFKSVVCINYEHVDFGEYADKVDRKEKTFRQAAAELIDGGGTCSIRKRHPLIGEILVKQNRITQENLEEALKEQRRLDDGTLLGDILKRMFNITSEEIMQALELQNGE